VGAVVLVARVFEHPPGALAVDVRDGDERRAEPDVRPAVPFEENDVVLGEHAEVVVDGVDVAVQAVCECSDARRGFLARSTCWPKPPPCAPIRFNPIQVPCNSRGLSHPSNTRISGNL
jgi:hypothetical protein